MYSNEFKINNAGPVGAYRYPWRFHKRCENYTSDHGMGSSNILKATVFKQQLVLLYRFRLPNLKHYQELFAH